MCGKTPIMAQLKSVKSVFLLSYCVICTQSMLWSLMSLAANARNHSDKVGASTVAMQISLLDLNVLEWAKEECCYVRMESLVHSQWKVLEREAWRKLFPFFSRSQILDLEAEAIGAVGEHVKVTCPPGNLMREKPPSTSTLYGCFHSRNLIPHETGINLGSENLPLSNQGSCSFEHCA